jgi:hypothetical protein
MIHGLTFSKIQYMKFYIFSSSNRHINGVIMNIAQILHITIIQTFQSFETTIQQIIKPQQKNSFDKYDISMNVFIHLNYPVV